jgi:hypothetical protein
VQAVAASLVAVAGLLAAIQAVRHERRMQRHRQPGVTYGAATLRRDGGWRRSDLFTPEGLRHQARAARYGVAAAVCWLVALVLWVMLAV